MADSLPRNFFRRHHRKRRRRLRQSVEDTRRKMLSLVEPEDGGGVVDVFLTEAAMGVVVRKAVRDVDGTWP
jgi:hypothetical protein